MVSIHGMSEMRSNWLLILTLWFAGLGAAGQYGKISVTYDALGTAYPEVGAALPWAVSLVGLVGIFLGIVAGLFVARIGFRRALLGGMFVGAALSIVQGLMPPFGLLLASRVIEGAAHLLIVVAAPTLIAQNADDAGRGFALTLWGTFFGVAFTILAWAGVPLVNALGLGALYIAHGIWMAVFGTLLWLMLPKAKANPPNGPIGNIFKRHIDVYRSPFISAPAIGWLFYTLTFLSMLTFIPGFVDPEWREPVRGAMPLMSIVSSMTLGVWLLKRTNAIFVIKVGFLMTAAMLVALFLVPGSPIVCLAFAAGLGLVQGASFAAVPELNAEMPDRALANGGLAQMGNLGNTLGTPFFAWIIASGGYGPMVLTAAFVVVVGLMAHIALGWARDRMNPA